MLTNKPTPNPASSIGAARLIAILMASKKNPVINSGVIIFRVTSYGLRVTGCELRVTSYALRVAGCVFRVTGCTLRVTGINS